MSISLCHYPRFILNLAKSYANFSSQYIYRLWIIANTSCAVYVHMRRLSLIHILYIFIVKYKC